MTGADKASSVSSSMIREHKGATRWPANSKTSRDKLRGVATGSSSLAKTDTASSGATSRRQPVGVRHQSYNRFIKPKPKSPTKPVHLPSSLTAPTASSVSKVHDSQSSHRIQQGTRSILSTSSQSFQKLTEGRGNHQYSAASSPRPSGGPPPSKSLPPIAASKRPSNIDESFLARMMRPTQSSSSRIADRVPLTPPKRTNQRSGGRQHSGSSDRASARSVSSRGSHTKKTPAIELSDRTSPLLIEAVHLAAVTKPRVDTAEDKYKNHDSLDRMVHVSQAGLNNHADEGAPEMISVNETVPDTSTTTTTENSLRMIPKMAKLRDHDNTCGHNAMMSIEPEFPSKDREFQARQAEGHTVPDAPMSLTVPHRDAGSAGDLLATVNEQTSETSSQVAEVENTDPKGNLQEQIASKTHLLLPKPMVEVFETATMLSATSSQSPTVRDDKAYVVPEPLFRGPQTSDGQIAEGEHSYENLG
ncbi:hypothetical protein C2857_002060 [Epichloe festucae Fl1]|uniref:Uncharacterized protein n=1 Tax=Epichloe festucae (strain Fl1) TaxID=877507 RepID=A0A7S9PTJ4_EPIFF|nr:hypothetical protein C2857_002060 [Epichloe festucae Fl1]